MSGAHAPVVDGHAHLFERGLPMATPRRYTPDRDARLPQYLAELDARGFSHGVLVQPSFLGEDNSYLLAALEACPQRLRGVVVVPHTVPETELRQLAEAGVVGVRLNLVGADAPDLAAPAWAGFLQRLRRVGLHVEVTGDAVTLHQALPPLVAAGCQVVIDHFGRPDGPLGVHDPGFHGLLEAGPSGQVWVKLSAVYRMHAEHFDAPAVLEQLLGAFGAERLVWGSDWPHTHYTGRVDFSLALALFDGLGLTPGARRQILGASAAALFRIGSGHGG